ncbi:leucine-rich repeat domain-containing protein [Kutzneria sp. NPDC051319]|uniref:leucine-rich repeat domain-containing protein n=1 Tax=Kutzneria sp. NPDC051319 TaxID=3155047 RepID=UPI003423558B
MQDRCYCLIHARKRRPREVRFHPQRQDTDADGWLRLLELIDEAAADGRPEFAPLRELTEEQRGQVIELPPTIGRLTDVRKLVLYGSNLRSVPPEIGAMAGLWEFDPYTSYWLHWFPYEITRCPNLVASTVSTRALYGNVKFRMPFPALDGTKHVTATCSVCDGPIRQVHQVWISLAVATDVLPLLVNACSPECVAALPRPPEGYVPTAHTGGLRVKQPPAD